MGKVNWPALQGRKLEAIVRRHCGDHIRQSGSHRTYVGLNGKPFTFAFSAGDTVDRGLVRKVLVADVGLTVDQAKKEVGL